MSAPQPFDPRRRAPASPPPHRIRPNTSPSRRPVGIQIPHAASSICLNDVAYSSAPAGPFDLTEESHVEHNNMAVTQDSNGTSANFRIHTGVGQPRRTPMADGTSTVLSISGSSGTIYPSIRSNGIGRRRSGSRRPPGVSYASRNANLSRDVDLLSSSLLGEANGHSFVTPVRGHFNSGNGRFFAGRCSDPQIYSRSRVQCRPSDIAAQLAKSNRTPD